MQVYKVRMGIFSFSRNIGIDMGTARTRLYVPYRGVVFDEPSIVALGKKRCCVSVLPPKR